MSYDRQSIHDSREHLLRCWHREFDLDPLILRIRVLRFRGAWLQVQCLEQELQPLI